MLGEILLPDMPYNFPEHTEIENGKSVHVNIEHDRLKAHGLSMARRKMHISSFN
ncbi:hypothetical protein [Staphylococcus succinus]|uniref:hypothetical protein n=1 Tax=Staphylococcus succinus TaxID=61015 RepID=UPI001304E706|nr:hypothetical protein [Staphylococcus succinus]